MQTNKLVDYLRCFDNVSGDSVVTGSISLSNDAVTLELGVPALLSVGTWNVNGLMGSKTVCRKLLKTAAFFGGLPITSIGRQVRTRK